jgi:hypothetical protein
MEISVLAGVVYRGVGVATASSEGTLLAGDISQPPAKKRSFVLVVGLCCPLAERHTVLAVHISHCQHRWNHECWRVAYVAYKHYALYKLTTNSSSQPPSIGALSERSSGKLQKHQI